MASRIEDYGMIGDLRTAALVDAHGSIDWLCLPRFDSPACFAALLGDEEHGSWRLGPATGERCTRRRYRGDTLILETEWDTPDGSVRVSDAMPPRDGAADLVRVVEGLTGSVPMRTVMRLRFGYGRVEPWLRRRGTDLAAIAGPDAAWLDADVPLTLQDGAASADFTVAAGERVAFTLIHELSHLDRPRPPDPQRALAHTEAFWNDWIGGLRYEGEWDDAVRRSLITLKALAYEPTGGIAAAATTSLPEDLGGVRNWDYRFCWLRDAAFVLQSLLGTGFMDEAAAWRQWLLRAAAGDPAELQIMYGLDGRHWLPEHDLHWLPGYEGSAPVRVGNAASGQFQLDVWGETLDALHLARAAEIEPDESAWDLQLALLRFLERHWADPDDGLWEIRGARRHFVHSKVMAWAAFDRAVQAVERFGLSGPVERWRELRDRVHAEVCERGFDADRGTFTQFYGSKGLDAALLLLPQVGFLPWDDPRVVGTVEAVQEELTRDGFLLRYDVTADGGVDGLPGDEGVFVACTFWLVDALQGIGRGREARELFERLLGVRNDLGLLSEELDPVTGRHLGNTPQAYSHVGLVNAARHLSGAHPAEEPHAVRPARETDERE
ncbi:glycoside hydrolase family 15 protein [Glycomyces niveus]|uniref:Glycoside hydrolase family 15 protein n=1 Tax=Glycomyces niveus TaxID=2820287 RepID=A0ABS3TZE3_9ACTN|nr:glycoside hydrolase family 15 protein [Glycomyces sp. NEAU-S30]MBO3731892.1 glycoside hydrolase family 15 protein [Glycomyces sp. NEAU-S30]